MAKTFSTLERSVVKMTDALTDDPNQVTGFMFTLDSNGNTFDQFSEDAMRTTGYYIENAKNVPDGFTLIDDSYIDYINTLIENRQEHPYNTDKLPWCHFGGTGECNKFCVN